MRIVGYSTGSLSKSDFRWALQILEHIDVRAVELSALRLSELNPLVSALPELPLEHFSYISFHVPSRFSPAQERELVSVLKTTIDPNWPLVTHPDAIHDFKLWRQLGRRVCIENMDQRKAIGQTAEHLRAIFEELPEATLCFDIAHAKQIDPTMCESLCILEENRDRLRQIHMSEVDASSLHQPINRWALYSFSKVTRWIPADIPIILESPTVDDDEPAVSSAIRREIGLAQRAFEPADQKDYELAL